MKRKIIRIDEEKCNGCGLCIPNCPEGALQIIDGKARLISDLFCDGLGACIGHCPQGAITIEEREAEPYSERKVMENIVKQGKNVIKAHLEHLKEHGEEGYLKEAISFLKEKNIEIPQEDKGYKHMHTGCPGSRIMDFTKEEDEDGEAKVSIKSQLRQWPIQLMLVPPQAPYLQGAELLITADCVPFSYANFHQDFLKGKKLIICCPKLDDTQYYGEKLTDIFETNDIKSITVVHMEVPCCYGLVHIVEEAVSKSGKQIPFESVVISVKGDRL